MPLHAISYAAKVWGVSVYTARRLLDGGFVKSVTVAGRRLISNDEIERVEREGAGKPRSRRGKRPHTTRGLSA